MLITNPHPVQLPQVKWELSQIRFGWIRIIDQTTSTHNPSDYHPYYRATWVHQGRVQRRSGGQTVEATAGEWAFQHPGVSSSTYAAGTRCLQLAFTMDWPTGDSLLYPPPLLTWKTGVQPELANKAVRLQQLVSRELGDEEGVTYNIRYTLLNMHTFFRLRHLFYDWLISWEEVCRAHHIHWSLVPRNESKVISAACYLQELPLHEPIRTSEIAANLGLSTRHFTHLFHQHYGVPPKAYRLKIKLRKALEELRHGNREIKEIAAQLGYSHSTFTTWIKQQTGKTPTEIRNAQ
jgi:AraC-like DNA-binding protein